VSFTLKPWERDSGTNGIGSWVGPRGGMDEVENRTLLTLRDLPSSHQPFTIPTELLTSISLEFFESFILPILTKQIFSLRLPLHLGARGSTVAKAICYKPEGRGFETR
jgi:hypothetical protein